MIDATADRHPIDLLAEEFVARFRRNDFPSITEYAIRHPDLAPQIRSVFPAIVQMEDLKRGRFPAAADVAAPEWLGDCRIEREVGRGGMGVVYEAEQASLGRRVAVKVLTAAAQLGANHARRFLLEAQTMAQLHHTNIVPVFEVGEHEGLPYYVMQFIEGLGLDEIIRTLRERQGDADSGSSVTSFAVSPCLLASASSACLPFAWSPTEVARIGLQVAEALAYAHAQGTLHRDIKPSNLLLDVRGTVWVTDFGLAKRTDQGDITGPGETAGTLRYMPPERFQAQSDARGDVYSLGLTLYELLTLRPAFDQSDPAPLLKQVTTAVPPTPRRTDPAIPRDLETVVLKAMARDPADRYQAAEELASDLRRFLNGKPVVARRVRPVELVWRWCRRNPAVAGLLAVVATLLVVVAAVTSAGYVRARDAFTREANLHAEAEGQQRRAEANVALAMQAFEQIFTQATRRPDRAPGAGLDDDGDPGGPPVVSPDVAALLQNLLKFYDQFGERNLEDPRLQREIAKAYRRVGDIEQRLGQFEKAETAYRHAVAVCEKYLLAFPDHAERARETATLQNDLGLVMQMTGQVVSAEMMHRRALRTLTGSDPTPPVRFELARTHGILGTLYERTAQGDGGEGSHRNALNLLKDLLKDDPDNPEYLLAKARSHRSLCTAQSRKGKRDPAVADQGRAVGILDRLVKAHPGVPDYRYELSEVLLLSFYVWNGGMTRSAEADKNLTRAADLAKGLASTYPTVPQYQALRARTLQRLGAALQVPGQTKDPEPYLREAITLDRTLVTQFPSVPVYKLLLAEACQSLSMNRLRHKDTTAACALLTEATDAQQKFLRATPSNRFGWFVLAHQYQTLADAYRQQGDTEQADAATKKADAARKGR
jgi:serine/threonine protein kinase